MVHSSMSDMRPMYQGTARDLVDLLLRLTGAERTLAMPRFSLAHPSSTIATIIASTLALMCGVRHPRWGS